MKNSSLLAVFALSLLLLSGCNDNSSDPLSITLPAPAANNPNDLAGALAATDLSDLSDTEIAGLVYMREEEKLARDVYLTFADNYGMAIFNKIALAEQRHADSVLMLLDRYEIVDPVGDNPVGVFQNQTLQNLYDELVAKGGESLATAYYMGCTIEEIDIQDLVVDLADTEATDIQLVYNHLLAGSGNHLRAYVPTWEKETGEVYVPQFLSTEDFATIMSGTNTHGQGGGQGH